MTANTIGIDIGTGKTVFIGRSGEILLNEPTLAAVNPLNGELIAAGEEAKELCGSICSELRLISPVKNGAVCDFEIMRLMLKRFIQKALRGKISFFAPKAVVSLPYGMNDVQAGETLEVLRSAGIRDCKILSRPLASAIGAGVETSSSSGSMVIDIGAGLCEVCAICMGRIVSCETVLNAGDKFDASISSKIAAKFGIKAGKFSCEAIKRSLNECETVHVCGRNLNTGLPSVINIPSKELIKALDDDIKQIVLVVKHILGELPSALAGDILKNGITLCGGAANTVGLKEALFEQLGCKTAAAENAELSAAYGLSKYIDKKIAETSVIKETTA